MRSEFQFIRNIKDRFQLSKIGDDCAVIEKDEVSDLLITADLLVEDVDFRLEWAKPGDIGHKSLAVSLSDIAAMGGSPTFAMLSLGVPEDLWKDNFVDDLYSGWHTLANSFGVELIGGDVSSSDKLLIDSIVLGEVAKGKAVHRSQAMPGDLIYVSGTLGGAAAGLKVLERQIEKTEWNDYSSESIKKHLRPMPQVDLAKRLNRLGIVSAMIDISDGLSSDLSHICQASGVGAVIDSARIPIDPAVPLILDAADDALKAALSGGEDFELLFTAAADARGPLSEFSVTEIGMITESQNVEIIIDGINLPLEPRGFRHF